MRRSVALGLAAALLAVIAIVGGNLGTRIYQDWQNLRRPPTARLDDTSRIRAWMTVRFVANSHHVPVSALVARLGAPPGGDVTLASLARTRGVSPSEEEDEARRAVAELRASGAVAVSGPGLRGP